MQMSAELKWCVTWFLHFFGLFKLRYNWAKYHHCKICKIDFIEGPFWIPPRFEQPWKSPSSTGLNCIKLIKKHFANSHDYSKAMINFQSKFKQIKLVMVQPNVLTNTTTFNLSWLRFKRTEYKGYLTWPIKCLLKKI